MTTGRALDTFVALPPNFGTEYPCQHIGVSFIGDILYKTRVRCSWILVWGVFFPSSGVTTRTYLTRVATFPFTKLGRFAFNVDFGLFSLSPVDIVFLKNDETPALTLLLCSLLSPQGEAGWQAKNFSLRRWNFFLVKAGSAESILTSTPVMPRGRTSRLKR